LTAHRRESFGGPLREVFSAVRELVDQTRDLEVLYPVHPNPQVLEPAKELLSNHPRIRLTEPLDYLDLVSALKHAHLVLTDSGGIQEEAPTFGAPVLVLREATERPEGIAAGVARLVGTQRDRILGEAQALLTPQVGRDADGTPHNPYGDGLAGERIADIVVSSLTGRTRETRDWDGP
ncbi:MAG: UDP-N-acetylglucosamine 2-epimerase, partial [Gemmatimonadetes bacterium]|nr:UDP-N-acetylglucosamine 2-epimerase [Gemmatimonadota bacterium]